MTQSSQWITQYRPLLGDVDGETRKAIFIRLMVAWDCGYISTVNNIHDLPEKPGIYFIHDNENLVYIGKSRNIKARFTSHSKYSTQFVISCWTIPLESIAHVEQVLISVIKPVNNERIPSGIISSGCMPSYKNVDIPRYYHNKRTIPRSIPSVIRTPSPSSYLRRSRTIPTFEELMMRIDELDQ